MASDPPRANLPPLSLHVPEPKFRPGDAVDFAEVDVPAGRRRAPPRYRRRRRAVHRSRLRRWSACSTRTAARSARGTRGSTPDTLRQMLRSMALVRAFDERMFRAQRQGKTSFYMKCTGEEAVAVARGHRARLRRHVLPVLSPAGPADRARLAAGRHDEPDLFEQGRPAAGQAAADHVFGARRRLLLDLGQPRRRNIRRRSAGRWRSAAKGDTRIAATWCGEGSTAEGDFHSACTFASVYRAPVIFNVVNNQWAISSFSGFAGAEATTFAARAVGYGIAGLRVDGNDALAVYAATQWAAERARTNQGPTLIEHFTYRAEGHSTSDDPGQYRIGGRAQRLAARRPDPAAEGSPDRARRVGRGAPRRAGQGARRGGEGARRRRPRRTASSATACTSRSTRCSTACSRRCRGTAGAAGADDRGRNSERTAMGAEG